MKHSKLFLSKSFKAFFDLKSCSFFRKPGNGGPGRLVRVAFHIFFSNLFISGESFSVLSDDSM